VETQPISNGFVHYIVAHFVATSLQDILKEIVLYVPNLNQTGSPTNITIISVTMISMVKMMAI
jgi:hypothetical protein